MYLDIFQIIVEGMPNMSLFRHLISLLSFNIRSDVFYDIEPLDIYCDYDVTIKKKLNINHFVSLFHNNRMFHIQPSLPTFVSD